MNVRERKEFQLLGKNKQKAQAEKRSKTGRNAFLIGWLIGTPNTNICRPLGYASLNI